jgi:16S rRNA (adenine1518-N6/adenine1519-N6)-dimethyltransferase
VVDDSERQRPVATPFQAIPRKRFGQHFLVDRGVVDAIVRAIDPQPGDHLVEIGPGTGALTAPLLRAVGELDAIEIDRDLAPRLAARHGDALRIVGQDVLTVDFARFGDDLRIVGNLPYNISSPLLLHLVAFAGRVRDQHFMLQKEVIDRVAARPGGDMGRLSVILQNHYQIDVLLDVPPTAFDPPPKVDSAVMRMTPRAQPLTSEVAVLQSVVAAAFAQRRKMLRNTLGRWLTQQHPDFDLAAAVARDGRLQALDDPTRRAEDIDTACWCALADQLAQSSRPVPPSPRR